MRIYAKFEESYDISNVDSEVFAVDFDANDTISNLKTLITTRFTDISQDDFDIYLNDFKIPNEILCSEVFSQKQFERFEDRDSSRIEVVLKKPSSYNSVVIINECKCNIF